MKPPREQSASLLWLTAPLILGVVFFDILIPYLYVPAGQKRWMFNCYSGVFIAQIGLFAAVVVLATESFLIRIASLPLAAVLGVWYFHKYEPHHELELFAYTLLAQWLIVAIAMLCPVIAGFRLRRFDPEVLGSAELLPHLQFSLRNLVLLVTATSLFAGLIVQAEWSDFTIILFVGGIFAVQTISLLPMTLVPQRAYLPICVVMGVIAGAMGLLLLEIRNPGGIAPALAFFVTPAIFQLPVLLLLRWRGFRLWRVTGRHARTGGILRPLPPIAPSPFLDSRVAQKSASIPDPKP